MDFTIFTIPSPAPGVIRDMHMMDMGGVEFHLLRHKGIAV
jgi:hypothetical protein